MTPHIEKLEKREMKILIDKEVLVDVLDFIEEQHCKGTYIHKVVKETLEKEETCDESTH